MQDAESFFSGGPLLSHSIYARVRLLQPRTSNVSNCDLFVCSCASCLVQWGTDVADELREVAEMGPAKSAARLQVELCIIGTRGGEKMLFLIKRCPFHVSEAGKD